MSDDVPSLFSLLQARNRSYQTVPNFSAVSRDRRGGLGLNEDSLVCCHGTAGDLTRSTGTCRRCISMRKHACKE